MLQLLKLIDIFFLQTLMQQRFFSGQFLDFGLF